MQFYYPVYLFIIIVQQTKNQMQQKIRSIITTKYKIKHYYK